MGGGSGEQKSKRHMTAADFSVHRRVPLAGCAHGAARHGTARRTLRDATDTLPIGHEDVCC